MSKKDTWKMILQTLISILTAIGTTLGGNLKKAVLLPSAARLLYAGPQRLHLD